MFDQDSSLVVRSQIDLFAFRSNPVSKVYQHRSRNGGILEVAWSTGSLRKNSKDTAAGELTPDPFPQLQMEQALIEHALNGSLLTYITIADAMVNDSKTSSPMGNDLSLGSQHNVLRCHIIHDAQRQVTLNLKQ